MDNEQKQGVMGAQAPTGAENQDMSTAEPMISAPVSTTGGVANGAETVNSAVDAEAVQAAEASATEGGAPVTETVATETMMAETMVPSTGEESAPVVEASMTSIAENGKPEKKTKNLGFKIAVAVLAVVAAGGIGFGAWAMISGQQETKSLNSQITSLKAANAQLMENASEGATIEGGVDETVEGVVVTKNVISNDLAQNLVNPYIQHTVFFNDTLGSEFNDDIKFFIAFRNLNDDQIIGKAEAGIGTAWMHYSSINSEYQYLFGSSSDIERRDYAAGYYTFKYDADNQRFDIVQGGGGGAGPVALISVVKNAYFDGDSIVVEMYHDVLSTCDADNEETAEGFCIDAVGPVTVNLATEYNMQDIINRFGDRIPVRRMIFVPNAGHYVLSDIQ